MHHPAPCRGAKVLTLPWYVLPLVISLSACSLFLEDPPLFDAEQDGQVPVEEDAVPPFVPPPPLDTRLVRERDQRVDLQILDQSIVDQGVADALISSDQSLPSSDADASSEDQATLLDHSASEMGQ